MASITTRVDGSGQSGVTVKGSPLTNSEIDANFLSLNNNKLESSWTGNTSVVTLGTVTTGTWNATTIATAYGGTGQTTYSSGQLLIGTSGGSLAKATLTGTVNQVSITNGSGSITISTPQDIASSSNVQFGSLGIGTGASGTSGEIRATNQITSYYSDERLKENITVIENALDKVVSLSGVTYNANKLAESFGFTNKEKQVGVLAGEVKKVLPEAVKAAPFDIIRIDENTEISRSGENYMTVQYDKLVPLLIEAIKELNEQIKLLKSAK